MAALVLRVHMHPHVSWMHAPVRLNGNLFVALAVPCFYPAARPERVHAKARLALPQAWHAGDVSASLEQGEAGELAGVPRVRQARPLSARIRTCMPVPWGAYVLGPWLSVLCMRSKAWLAAPVLLAHAEVTKSIIYVMMDPNPTR